MEDENHRELQLLPPTMSMSTMPMPMATSSSSLKHHHRSLEEAPSLDLQLSISSVLSQQDHFVPICNYGDNGCVEALKWQAAEQIRLAALEKAYAEHVRELTKREMEMAQSEFARARHVWERARQEVERADRLKERATRRNVHGSTCMEITCHSCRQRFQP